MGWELTPAEAARAAIAAYSFMELKDGDNAAPMATSSYEKELSRQFETQSTVLVTGKTGGFGWHPATGFGAFSMGKDGRRGQALLALRGTQSFADVLTDLTTAISPGRSGRGVHHGFQDTFDSFRGTLDTLLKAHKPTAVHVSGHSLGGALATLAAEYIAARRIPVKLYTFGSPRTGLSNFALGVDKAVGADNIYRCYHSADPVPMLPVFPFLHVCVSNGGFLLPSPGDICDPDQHAKASYFTDLKLRSWEGIQRTRSPFRSLSAAQAWLERAASKTTHIPLMSSSAITLLGQALNIIIQIAAGTSLALNMAADSALDLIAMILARGAAAVAHIGLMVRNAMIVCMKIVGISIRLMATGEEVAQAFIRWVLQALFTAIGASASRALQLVAR